MKQLRFSLLIFLSVICLAEIHAAPAISGTEVGESSVATAYSPLNLNTCLELQKTQDVREMKNAINEINKKCSMMHAAAIVSVAVVSFCSLVGFFALVACH